MKFKERFTEALIESGLKQKDLAKLLQIDPANITNWKSGKNVPSIDLLYELCKILKISADYLIGIEDENGIKIFETNNKTYNNFGTHNGNVEIK